MTLLVGYVVLETQLGEKDLLLAETFTASRTHAERELADRQERNAALGVTFFLAEVRV